MQSPRTSILYLETAIDNINRIDYSIKNTNSLWEPSTSTYKKIQSVNLLKSFIFNNSLINDVVILDNDFNVLNSTVIEYNSTQHIFQNGKKANIEYENFINNSNNFIILEIDAVKHLVYIPDETIFQKITVLYILDNKEIENLLDNLTELGIYKVELQTFNNQLLYTTLDENSSKNNDASMVEMPLHNGSLKLNVFLDEDYLSSASKSALSNIYYVVIIFIVLYSLIVFFALKKTFLPLKELFIGLSDEDFTVYSTKDIIKKFNIEKEETQEIAKVITMYQEVAYKSILENLINSFEHSITSLDINNFFNSSYNNQFITIKTSGKINFDILNNCLKNSCEIFVVNLEDSCNTFILYFNKFTPLHLTNLMSMLKLLANEQNSYIGISEIINNPIKLPVTYDQSSISFKKCSEQNKLTIYEKVEQNSTLSYPRKNIELFSDSIKKLDFVEAKNCFKSIHLFLSPQHIPEFFISCVVIDILTFLVSQMNESNVKLVLYYKYYKKIDSLCKDKNTKENLPEIIENINILIDIYEKETSGETKFNLLAVINFIEANYSSVEMSLNYICDKFNVSPPYLSKIFHQKIGIKVTNHIWKLRFNKACELLKDENISLDDVATMVGYDTYSSFHRKFKTEAGITPNQYRFEQH